MGEPEAVQRDDLKGSPAPVRDVRFGPFALDLRGGELCKEGRRIRIQEQPFLILRMLLESPGEIVTREEIRKRLWPDDTVVEFDHSINAAVNRLRDVLRDSAGKPRYIETIPRRGYRFVGDVEAAERPAPASEPVAIAPENAPATRPAEPVVTRPPFLLRHLRIFVPVLAAAIILMVWAGEWYYRHGARPLAGPLQPLMRLDLDLGIDVPPSAESGESGAIAVLSPDGTRLVYRSQSKLFTRRLDQRTATEVLGTERAGSSFLTRRGVGCLLRSRKTQESFRSRGPGDRFERGCWRCRRQLG